MSSDEQSLTYKYAETALKHLKNNQMPAHPRNYELLYTYAAGVNQELNKSLNEILQQKLPLSTEILDRNFETYLSPSKFSDRVEEVGEHISEQLSSLIENITRAGAESSHYTQSLAGASRDLTQAADKDQIQAIVAKLALETKKVESRNRELENKLQESKQQINHLQNNLETVRTESLTDALTSLSNRKYFDGAISKMIAHAEKTGEVFSLLFTDVDHFKKFNDTHGHQTGDQVLRLVAQATRHNVKGRDVAARYGGEEFAILLPETPLQSALRVAENVRVGVMGKDLIKRSTNEKLGRVTISIGAAAWRAGDSVQSIIERADAALYLAKGNGRNRVQSETDLKSHVA